MNITKDKKENTKEIILNELEHQLKNVSLHHINVDAISKVLHISKRTIYELFDSKEQLIDTVISRIQDKFSQIADNVQSKIHANEINFTEGVIILYSFLSKYATLSKEFYKLYPQKSIEWQENHKAIFRKLFALAKNEGLLNENVNLECVFFISRIFNIALHDDTFRKQYNVWDEFQPKELFQIVHNGILSDKGRQITNQLKNEINC